jgi:dipeptidyl aminopeptidase/acylaminoacyl peptidase
MKTVFLNLFATVITFLSMNSCQTDTALEEKQITSDPGYHHDLDNNDNFSPDGEWLVYDTRTDDGGIAASSKIEKVNVSTGEKKILFEIENNSEVWGPGAGAVSYSPKEHAVVFIHGLDNSTKENPYQQWRRTGVIIKDEDPNVPIYMDARDVTFPYTPGALRGGTHRHEWSGDGQWIGYTYNDAILKALEDSTGKKMNLRTIGVSKNIKPVKVDQNGENISGEWFSALVVRVVPEPKPGSDEILLAASDSWVGVDGYVGKDGKKQMARAFLGTVIDKNGEKVPEVFIVDIPDDITQPGEFGPLEGTKTSFPMPPKGTVQRRLTHTADSPNPGCTGIVRSSPDGSTLAFLSHDTKGIQQVFLISPNGGKPVQLTEHDSNVSGNVRWHPDGKHVSYAWNGSIVLCKIGNAPFKDRHRLLTSPTTPAPTNMVWSPDGKNIAFNRLVVNGKDSTQQVFVRTVR